MEEIRLTSWYGRYPIIYRVSYMPGGAGFLNHQQYARFLPFTIKINQISNVLVNTPYMDPMGYKDPYETTFHPFLFLPLAMA